jgi:hypothetical protein
MVVRQLTPDTDYVRYAFGRATDRLLYFYAADQQGDAVTIDDPSGPVVQHGRIEAPGHPEFDAFLLTLSGFAWVVSPVPLSRTTGPMLLRPRTLRWSTPLGFYDVSLSWDGEPSFSWSVDQLPPGLTPRLAVVRPAEDVTVRGADER